MDRREMIEIALLCTCTVIGLVVMTQVARAIATLLAWALVAVQG